MYPLCVVPDEVIYQFAVELIDGRHNMRMVIDEFFLDRAIEPLAMGIHLGSLRIGMVMDHVQAPQFLVKMFHELAAIVGQDKGDRERKYLEAKIKEFLGG